jgi:predicted DsbA family dithiol-disulfide isomerase
MVAKPMTSPAKLTIDIYSDVMCPWCIIGYAQLQKGLAMLEGEVEAEVRWLPFELNPEYAARRRRSRASTSPASMAAARPGRCRQPCADASARRARGLSFAYTGAGEPEPKHDVEHLCRAQAAQMGADRGRGGGSDPA